MNAPQLMTEKELLAIVDGLIRDAAYNRPAAVAIGMAVGAAVEAEVRERYAPLMQAVEWLLDDGHMNQEHLARLRAAFELTRET